MRVIATEKAEQNRAALDPWTVVHFSSGLAMGLMEVPLRWALLAAASYEVIEQAAERETWGQDLFNSARPESFSNALMDVVVFAAGHWLGSLWNQTGR